MFQNGMVREFLQPKGEKSLDSNIFLHLSGFDGKK